MFTRATLVSLSREDRGRVRAVLSFDGADAKPVQRDYEFGGIGLTDTFLVDTAASAIDELNQIETVLAKMSAGTVLVDRS